MGFFSGLGSAIVGSIGGLIGSGMDASHERDLARMNQNFQEKVYQNQIQWKAADAKKAGLHPLAVLGGGSYSASNIASSGGTNYAGALGKLGEGIGDAFTAYMNKDQIKELEDRAKAKDDQQTRLVEAQIKSEEALAKERNARTLSYSRPMATGHEYMPGQVDSGNPPVSGSPDSAAVIIRPVESVNGSVFEQPYDINLSSDYQQELGDETGQIFNLLQKAAREGRHYFRDTNSGREFRFDRSSGRWYEITGGGGGV